MAGSLILSGNPPGNLPVSRWAILSGNYLNNLSHRFIHISNFLRNWTLALPRGVHSLSGGALTTFPCKYGPEKNFLRPGGARTPPGYAYAGLITVPVVPWEGAPPPKGSTNCQFLPCCFDI